MVKISEIIAELEKKNIIGKEDKIVAEVILRIMFYGVKKLPNRPEFKQPLQNLKEANCLSRDGRIYVSEDWESNSGIEFALLVCCAKGFIKRST